jgi:hypothetical protein
MNVSLCSWGTLYILKGTRSIHTDKLLRHLNHHHNPKANLATTTSSAKPPDLVALAHATLFSSTISALQVALKNNFLLNFQVLLLLTLNKYPPHSIATAKGHMNQQQQRIKSTKQAPMPSPLLPEPNKDMYPRSNNPNDITNICFNAAVMEPTGFRTKQDVL